MSLIRNILGVHKPGLGILLMDKGEIIRQLAGRMGASEERAEAWLAATLEVLHGVFPGNTIVEAKDSLTSEGGDVGRSGGGSAGLPALRSVTPTARLSIGDEIVLDRFPFRVGREGRAQLTSGIPGQLERQLPPERTNNDLYVKDFGTSVNVSREHFQIEVKGDGSYELVDRGSACGTIVGDCVVGGNLSGGRCPLEFGDTIIVGTQQSAIVFEFSQTSG